MGDSAASLSTLTVNLLEFMIGTTRLGRQSGRTEHVGIPVVSEIKSENAF